MNDRIVVMRRYLPLFQVEILLQMFPVTFFLVKFESVVELVHFDLIGKLSANHFSEQPSI